MNPGFIVTGMVRRRFAVIACSILAVAVVAGASGGAQARASSQARASGQAPVVFTGFTGLACPSSSFCLAVGGDVPAGAKPGTVATPLLEEWNGKTWQILPNPPGFLFSVTCGSLSFCLANVEPPGATRVVAWNGKSWKAFQPQPPDPHEVNCLSPAFCLSFSESESQVVEHDGTQWTVMPVGEEPGCAGFDCNLDQGSLNCVSSAFCTVDGTYCDVSACHQILDFAITWNGKLWDQSGTPPFTGSQACARNTFCLLVGPPAQAAVSHDRGHHWQDASADLARACKGIASCFQPAHLACGSATSCLMLPAVHPGLALSWNGTAWTRSPMSRIDGHFPKLTNLACGSARNCIAIGTRHPSSGSHLLPVAERWTGKTWQFTPMPTP